MILLQRKLVRMASKRELVVTKLISPIYLKTTRTNLLTNIQINKEINSKTGKSLQLHKTTFTTINKLINELNIDSNRTELNIMHNNIILANQDIKAPGKVKVRLVIILAEKLSM